MASQIERPHPLNNITIGRLNDSDAQGVIRPEDGSWQLVIDSEGFPHLYIRVKIAQEGSEPTTGLLALDDMLIGQMSIKDLMSGGEFGGELGPEEIEEAHAAYERMREENPVPCPRA